MSPKEKLILVLEEEGYLPDEARSAVEGSWWIIKMYVERVLFNQELI